MSRSGTVEMQQSRPEQDPTVDALAGTMSVGGHESLTLDAVGSPRSLVIGGKASTG
jgi:hypothetical protein